MYAWKKLGYSGVKQELVEVCSQYVASGRDKVKVWGQLSRFLLVDCCSWGIILGSAYVEIC